MVDWNAVEAIATSASAVLTAIVLIYAIQQTRAAHRSADAATTELQAALDDRKRMQAESISGWVVSVSRRDEPYKSLFGGIGEGFGLAVHLSNVSQQPVWNVKYTVVNTDTLAMIANGVEAVLPPSQGPKLLTPGPLQTLAPTDVNDRKGHEEAASRISVLIEFTDSRGSTWTRHANGSLREVTR